MHETERRPLVTRIALLLVTASAGRSRLGLDRGAAAVETGLMGKVLRGPVTPVCRDDKPCYAPYKGLLLFTKVVPVGVEASAPVRAQSEPDGDYRVALAPARYRVSTGKAGRFGNVVRPTVVAVPSTGMRRVNFLVDTGIR
jgi:hypothetical protein